MTRKDKTEAPADAGSDAAVDIAAVDGCFGRIREILASARASVARSVNTTQVVSYWLIGREIVEEEQRGAKRAEYGQRLLAQLAVRMQAEFGRGYSVHNLKFIRRLYIQYPHLLPQREIGYAASIQLPEGPTADVPQPGILNPNLSWTHYRVLCRVENDQARSFYELEAAKHCWPVRELERHINTLLYERLSRSRDKEALLQATLADTATQHPVDMLKDPLVMEFMGLSSSSRIAEAEMEQAIVDNMEEFLREMGNGFAYINRQQRITVDGDHFYIDLVLYHTTLKCHVVVELKCGKFEPRDLGQLQFYVNYYDAERRQPGENPTLGLLLCADKNEAVVRYTIGKENRRLFASKYVTQLPTEGQLQEQITRELRALSADAEIGAAPARRDRE